MDVSHKKKSRVRNRQRHKCNRLDEKQQAECQDMPGKIPEPNQAIRAENNSKGTGDIKQKQRQGIAAGIANLFGAGPQPEQPKIDPQTAINVIQDLLRKRLLAKTKDTLPCTANVADTRTQSQPPKLKTNEKNEQMNALLKCIGNKLQKGSTEMPTGELISKLGKMFSTEPLSDQESSDDEAEYVEYIYKPRQYFMASLCNHCKLDLCNRPLLPCKGCGLVFYCTVLHMRDDQEHRQLCHGLRQLVERNGHDIFYKSGDFSAEQFRSFRIVCIRQLEQIINRSLTATEQEVLLFPYICSQVKCREHRLKRLAACTRCGELAYCKDAPDHLSANHDTWCGAYRLFKAFIRYQAKFGRLEPPLPEEVLRAIPIDCGNTRQILKKLNFNVIGECEYAALTQISTGPLTAYFALRLCQRLDAKELTIHLIGAEMEFEVDVFQKWEIFLLHILPGLKKLTVVFVGPELNAQNISFDHLKRIKCCRLCRKAERRVEYHFENCLYHDYCTAPSFLKPDLVCFFNAGLYRSTGFAMEDTWPDTVRAALNLKCSIVVTSYTKYEAPLDMLQFLNQSNRHLNVILPPTTNPFGSEKPERNFISDDETPFMFKNYQCFVVE